MKENFYERLNLIRTRISSPELLSNSGLGNEIGFYIFDYPADKELIVRSHLEKIVPEIPRKLVLINLFALIVDFLKAEKMLDDALALQIESGDAELLSAFHGIIEGARIAPLIVEKINFNECDAVILTGVGNAYPLIRIHDLLNNLQVAIKNIPLIVFYPGEYSGQSLSFFGALKDENYYRAFRLVG